MLSLETERKVAQLLFNLAIKEKDVEINRQVLAQNLDFDAYQAFTTIDVEGKNSIDAVNIIDFLRKNGIYANLTEAKFLILFYDENADDSLSYTEFLNLVLSENNFSLRRLARERVGSSYPRQNLPFNVEYSLVKLFEKELQLIRSTLSLIDDVKMRYDFNVHDIFHLIKDCNCITLDSLRAFLQRNQVCFSDDDVLGIMKRLDLNKDRRIDFNEFHLFFSFPNFAKCCSCIHACKCCCCLNCSCCCIANSRRMSPLRTTAISTNDISSFGNRPMSPEVRRISPNLSLRLSPERRFSPRGSPRNSPRRASPLRNTYSTPITNMAPIRNNYSTVGLNNGKSTLSLRLSPQRNYSPRREASPVRSCSPRRCSPRCSPRRCSPRCSPRRCSPLRCCSVCCHSPCTCVCCNVCHCTPCCCKCCSVCHCSPCCCNCCSVCHCSPCCCNCCSVCHFSPCRCCCSTCHCNPCRCCQLAFDCAESGFINYMKEAMNCETQIEKAKIDLALRSDFNVEDAYRIFELDGRGIITEADLKYGLNQLDIYASANDIKLLMKRADLKRTGSINYGDFFDLVTPYEKEYRTMVENRLPSSFRPQFNKADVFLLSTKIYLQNLLRLIINVENKLEGMKIGLKGARDYLGCIYKDMDRCGMGVFSDLDLADYFKRKGVYVSDKESGLGFIRLDRNRNGKVEYWELSDEISYGC